MKKLILSAAVLAIFTGGMTATVNFAAPETAVACEATSNKSTKLASKLPQVKYGNKGQHVLALQLALRIEGYTYLKGTGTYGKETLRAVKDFQRKHRINASGTVGSKTWQALVGRKSKDVTGDSLHVVPTFTLKPGERGGDKVFQLENMLMRIHPYYDWNFDGQDGVYGPGLQKMVRDFQKRAGFKPSGTVGPKTVAALNEVVSVSGQWGC